MPKDIVNEDDRTRNVTLRGVAADKGVLTFPLSSEEPYRRYDGNEILVHDKKSVDLSFLNSGNAPLLDNHNRHTSVRTQIGVIDKAWLSGKRIYVTVRFSNRAEAQEIKQDIEDGILTNVSVGYDVLKVERDADSEDYRVTSWKPKEASVVSVPADTTVGVGRAATMEGDMPKDENSPSREGERIEMPAGVPAQVETQPTEADRGAEIAAAQEEIFALGAVHNMRDEASKFINTEIRAGRVPSLAAFRGLVATQLPADRELVDTSIGLTDKETRGFSVLRLARAMADGATQGDRRAAEFEIEACTEAARSAEGETRGYRLPMDVMNRWTDFEIEGVRYQDVRAALSTTGNPNVQDTDHLAGRFIDNLRNQMSIMRAGVTVLGGLSGNIEIPGGDTNAAGAWLAAEDADAAETVPTFRKVTMDIKDVAGYTDLTRRMIIQSSIDVEAYVRSQLT
ncbi:MAG: phage major capsid protein, partial [Boseongicola sp.]|nr:phage major capsid protein [Boseongicola sp.]